MTNKEADLNSAKKKLNSLHIMDENDVIMEKINMEFTGKSSENHEAFDDDKKESESNTYVEMNNHKNKNQPF